MYARVVLPPVGIPCQSCRMVRNLYNIPPEVPPSSADPTIAVSIVGWQLTAAAVLRLLEGSFLLDVVHAT